MIRFHQGSPFVLRDRLHPFLLAGGGRGVRCTLPIRKVGEKLEEELCLDK